MVCNLQLTLSRNSAIGKILNKNLNEKLKEAILRHKTYCQQHITNVKKNITFFRKTQIDIESIRQFSPVPCHKKCILLM